MRHSTDGGQTTVSTGLLSIDILRPYIQEKSLVSHVARLCYANKPLGRLSDLLLPPQDETGNFRGRTQSRRSRRDYADADADVDVDADADADVDELIPVFHDVPRDIPSSSIRF